MCLYICRKTIAKLSLQNFGAWQVQYMQFSPAGLRLVVFHLEDWQPWDLRDEDAVLTQKTASQWLREEEPLFSSGDGTWRQTAGEFLFGWPGWFGWSI
jgi:hypothetical protein